jgi:hypothetical protein
MAVAARRRNITIQWHFQGGISPPLALHSAKRLCRAVIYLTHPIAAARNHEVLTERHSIGGEMLFVRRKWPVQERWHVQEIVIVRRLFE